MRIKKLVFYFIWIVNFHLVLGDIKVVQMTSVLPKDTDVINLSSDEESDRGPIIDRTWKRSDRLPGLNSNPSLQRLPIPSNATVILLTDDEEDEVEEEEEGEGADEVAPKSHSVNTASAVLSAAAGAAWNRFNAPQDDMEIDSLEEDASASTNGRMGSAVDFFTRRTPSEMPGAFPGAPADVGAIPSSSSSLNQPPTSNGRLVFTANTDVDDGSDSDDIIEVDPNEVQKQKFKKTSFEDPAYERMQRIQQRHNQEVALRREHERHMFELDRRHQFQRDQDQGSGLLQGPAPVPHWGPEHTSADVFRANQKDLASRLEIGREEKRKLQGGFEKVNVEKGRASNRKSILEQEFKEVSNERQVLATTTSMPEADIRLQHLESIMRIKSREIFDLNNFIEKCQNSLESLGNRFLLVVREVKGIEAKLEHMNASNGDYNSPFFDYSRLHIDGGIASGGQNVHDVVDIDERNGEILKRNLMGFANNVYSGSNLDESRDLQNLIDNIRTDEEEPEDGKGLANTPPEMCISLLKHQRLGLSWLLRMELNKSKGGILADDMGLGKTVQAISLILANKSAEVERKTTLIIAPVSLLRQWAAEIASKIKPQFALSVAIYHGSDKKPLARAKDMLRYDVVLTSFGTLASEWKKHFAEALKNSQVTKNQNVIPDLQSGGISYVSPFYDAKESKFYRIILDEAHLIKNKVAISSKAVHCLQSTYKLCMTGTPMQNTVAELFPLIRFLQIRPYNDEQKFRYTFVIPLKKGAKSDDEDAQYDAAPAMKKLRALLGAILLRRNKSTEIDGKPILNLPDKHVTENNAVMQGKDIEFYSKLESNTKKKARELLSEDSKLNYSNILVLLLRLRQACCHPYLVKIGEERKTDREMAEGFLPRTQNFDWGKMYDSCVEYSPATVEQIQQEVGDSQTELAFSCPLCYDATGYESVVLFPGCGHMICSYCVEVFFQRFEEGDHPIGRRHAKCMTCGVTTVKENNLIDYNMFHKVHLDKLDKASIVYEMTSKFSNSPPKARSNAIIIKELIKQDDGIFTPSAKMEECLKLITKIMTETPEEKIIVFSQFVALFDLMKLMFDHSKIKFLQYDGSMSVEDKNATIEQFYRDPTISVMLLSLRAGNVGLTLTCASHVIIMDPFWNPYVEEQAQDRAYRIGQQREVYVHRLLIQDSVENRIMELQKLKKALVGAALNEGSLKNVSRLGRQELGFLFGLNAL